jgi:hypothetical protein
MASQNINYKTRAECLASSVPSRLESCTYISIDDINNIFRKAIPIVPNLAARGMNIIRVYQTSLHLSLPSTLKLRMVLILAAQRTQGEIYSIRDRILKNESRHK